MEISSDVLKKLLRHEKISCLNVGTGSDLSIRKLAEKIAEIAGYRGKIDWDLSKPDGTPRKLLDASKTNALGWRPKIGLDQGLEETFRKFNALGPES
jgi:GDP-L-fucose synthase